MNSRFVILIVIVYCSEVLSFRFSKLEILSKLAATKFNELEQSFNKKIRRSLISGIFLFQFSSPLVYASDIEVSSGVSQPLRAADLLSTDIAIYRRDLEDMQFVLTKVTDIVDRKDYPAFRTVLRSDPLVMLRKTSRTLKKYLPSVADQERYQASYQQVTFV